MWVFGLWLSLSFVRGIWITNVTMKSCTYYSSTIEFLTELVPIGDYHIIVQLHMCAGQSTRTSTIRARPRE